MEARLEQTDHGLVAKSDGWYVLNAREARWHDRGPRGVLCDLEGDVEFEQLGVNLFVLGAGDPMSMYHWEADQEDFLVLSGEALLIVEGEERPLRQWDFFHCPRGVPHTIVGGPATILAVGARIEPAESWGGYPLDDTAARHNAASEVETTDQNVAYARFPSRRPTAYRDGWLP
ncbi:MAG: cupin domain-containing protein [Gaiellaceae bacterium]